MTSVRPILINGGRVIDPLQAIDKVADVAIADAKILGVDSGIELEHAEVIDATGMIVCPGFIDLHTHLREPGFEYKETIATGTAAAASGWIHDRMRHAEHQPGNGLPVHRRLRAHEGCRGGSGTRPAHRGSYEG